MKYPPIFAASISCSLSAVSALTGYLLFILFGCSSCNPTQVSIPESICVGESGAAMDRMLTPAIEQVMDQWELPGVAIGIVQENEIVYAKAFGSMNKESGEPVNIHTMFHMASNSKPFVATAIMQLHEKGKIHLDSAVVAYLPYFSLLFGRSQDITIQQILSHVSGMPDEEDKEWEHPVYDQGALEQYVRHLALESMISQPGDRFSYSSMAFECLGDVVAKVSGDPFEEYVKKQVLDRAGMVESTFIKPDYLPENWAAPHTRIITCEPWNGYPYNRMHGPSSTLHSNVVEMCHWAIANMNHGKYKNRRFLQSSSYDLLWKTWFEVTDAWDIGLCWFKRDFRGENTIWHSGADRGFSSDFEMIPEKSMAVVVVCNLDPAPVKGIKEMALDLLLGYEPKTLICPANIPVLRALEEHGEDAAVALWDSLKMNHPEAYDFGPQHFIGLLEAIKMGLLEEAVSISQLLRRIYPEEIIEALRIQAFRYHDKYPDNQVAPAILKVFAKN